MTNRRLCEDVVKVQCAREGVECRPFLVHLKVFPFVMGLNFGLAKSSVVQYEEQNYDRC